MADSPTAESITTTRGYSARAVAAGFALGVIVVGWPNDPELVGVAFVVGFAGITALAFFLAYRAQAVLTALFVALTALAHGATLGDAVQFGLRRSSLLASAQSVRIAIALISIFVLLVTLASVAIQRRQRDRPRRVPRPNKAFYVGVTTFFLITMLAAIGTGTWTYWGGRLATANVSQQGFELLYPTMLFVGVAVAVLPVGTRRRSRKLRLPSLAISAVLVVMIFALQSRRVMFAAGILVALAVLRYPPPGARWASRNQLGVAVRVALLGVVLLFAVVASAGWRNAASSGRIGLAQGLGSALSAAFDPTAFDSEGVETRMTYLWLDSMTVELRDRMGLKLDIPDALAGTILYALPSAIYPYKETIERKTCESSFAMVGVESDLPCTPTSEGYLGLGYLGVVLAALLWGLYIGVTDVMTRRWSGLGRVAGLVLFSPAITIETGLFPMVQGARNMTISVVFIGAVMVVVGFLINQARATRPAPRATTRRAIDHRSD